MPEARAVAVGAEFVSEGFAGGDWALNSGGHTIHPLRVAHAQTMPVNSCAFRLLGANDVVLDFDLNHVSPVSLDGRTRKLAIDKQNRTLDTIRGNFATANFEVVSSRSSRPWDVVWMDLVGALVVPGVDVCRVRLHG